MNPFPSFESRMLLFVRDNVDTDQIFPARFLKTISKAGLGHQLFRDWRYDHQGNPRPDFVFNRPEAQGTQVLLAGHNFGCGSSREHAVWALVQFGFRAVISTSFADIFQQNALKNALLPIVVSGEQHTRLCGLAAAEPTATVRVDLASQQVGLPNGEVLHFPVDSFAKYCLLEGVDEIGYIERHEAQIAGFESKRSERTSRRS